MERDTPNQVVFPFWVVWNGDCVRDGKKEFPSRAYQAGSDEVWEAAGFRKAIASPFLPRVAR